MNAISKTFFTVAHLFNLDLGAKKKTVGNGHGPRELLGPGFAIENVIQWACAYVGEKGYEHLGEGAVFYCEQR